MTKLALHLGMYADRYTRTQNSEIPFYSVARSIGNGHLFSADRELAASSSAEICILPSLVDGHFHLHLQARVVDDLKPRHKSSLVSLHHQQYRARAIYNQEMG